MHVDLYRDVAKTLRRLIRTGHTMYTYFILILRAMQKRNIQITKSPTQRD